MAKGKTVVVWILSVLVAALFMFAGSFKLLKPAETHAGFIHYGYSAWFGTFIGICELLGGIGLLIPRLAALAATGLSIIMVGAFLTHVTHHEYSHSAGPLILLALLVLIVYMRVKE